MLNSAQTLIASSIAASDTPARRSGVTSAGRTSLGCSVSFSRKPSVARSLASSGALRQSSITAFTKLVSFSASAATAAWESVQKTHWFNFEVNAANSSRSPTLQSEGPRITACVHSHCGAPKNSGRYISVLTTSGTRRRLTIRMSVRISFCLRRWPCSTACTRISPAPRRGAPPSPGPGGAARPPRPPRP